MLRRRGAHYRVSVMSSEVETSPIFKKNNKRFLDCARNDKDKERPNVRGTTAYVPRGSIPHLTRKKNSPDAQAAGESNFDVVWWNL
jgi:hypothetical protein